ncbi:MAG: rRNA maturation RNase YbeY [Nannocystaceae bacterium]
MQRGTVAIRLVGEREMCRLHRDYYGARGSTDVLSFAPDAGDDLGDIALGWRSIVAQARRRGVHTLDEASLLAVHGLVHLLGHDHRTHRESLVMHRLERRALDVISVRDIARPYHHR